MKKNYFPKIYESTNKVIKNNKMMVFGLFGLLVLANVQIPILSFIFGVAATIILYIILVNVDRNGFEKKIDVKVGYNTGIGIYIGSLIVMITTTLLFVISLLILMYFSGYLTSLQDLRGLNVDDNAFEMYSIVMGPRLLLPLMSVLVFGIFMYIYPYFISKAIEKDEIQDSMETVMGVFNIHKWKRIFYNYDYFIYVLKYTGMMFVFMFVAFTPIALIFFFGLSEVEEVFTMEDGIKYSVLLIVYALYMFILGFYMSLYSYFFTYYIKFIMDGENENLKIDEENDLLVKKEEIEFEIGTVKKKK